MPAKFDFLSPGVLLREVDQSQIPAEVLADGPVIIGRARSGPGNKPVKVRSLEDFYAVFGEPVSGMGSVNNDVWREGNLQGATYGMYAAQAWLAAEVSPITYVRLLGEEDPNPSASGRAGWEGQALSTAGGGAFGLFMAPSASSANANVTGTLAAVFYSFGAATSVVLSGNLASDSATAAANCGALIDSVDVDGSPGFEVLIGDPSSLSTAEKISFNFNPDSNSYIRKVSNTNPQKTNGDIMTSTVNYFLGETFEESVETFCTSISSSATGHHGIILPLQKSDASIEYGDHRRPATAPCTGWFLSKDTGLATNYNATNMEKLFKVHSLHEGEWLQNNYSIGIKVVSLGTTFDPYSRFDLQVLEASSNKIVEEYKGLTLNPGDVNYVAKRIGDMSQEWDSDQLKYRVLGEYANISDYIRVEMAEAVKFQQLSDASAVPFGYYGPPRFKGFTMVTGSTYMVDTVGKATATLTITDAGQCLADNQISLITTGGDTVTITGHANANAMTTKSGASSDGTFAAGTTVSGGDANNKAQALAIATTISLHDDFTATAVDTAVVTITQNTAGPAGATTITVADNGGSGDISTSMTIVSFAHAEATEVFAVGNGAGNGGTNRTPALHDSTNANAEPAVHVPTAYTASFKFPSLRLTTTASNGTHNDDYTKSNYMGVNHQLFTSSVQDKSYLELLRALPKAGAASYEGQLGENTTIGSALEYSFIFSLDDVRYDDNTKKAFYASGSRQAGSNKSYTAVSGAAALITGSMVNRFVAPMYGGADGLDVTEMEPFANRILKLNSSVDADNYTAYTINKVLDSVSDSEVVSYDLMALPGVNVAKFTDRMIEICEDRGDALAVVDLEDNFGARPESTATSNGSVDAAVRTLKARNLNSSYACAYYPWVRLKDTVNGANDVFMCPPSVAAVGAMGRSQAVSEPWFAPAGFNRGGLSPLGGTKGPDVVGTWEHLTKDNRDSLYEANINPIARFPSTGDIVIFGQKTLQQTPSALDRINVRRLMIFLKKQIGVIADTILFDQNVEVTWNRFKTQANAVLGDVQARLGITEYKLVLDKTTTTPDLVDRNILYAKIFVKPARSIEFIVVDFIITRSGVEF